MYTDIPNSGQGIGRATALGFAAAGVKGLVLSARNDAKLVETATKAKELATNSSFETLVVVGDISQEDDIANVIKKAVEKFGKIDYAVNNAGVRLVQYFCTVSSQTSVSSNTQIVSLVYCTKVCSFCSRLDRGVGQNEQHKCTR